VERQAEGISVQRLPPRTERRGHLKFSSPWRLSQMRGTPCPVQAHSFDSALAVTAHLSPLRPRPTDRGYSVGTLTLVRFQCYFDDCSGSCRCLEGQLHCGAKLGGNQPRIIHR